MNLYVLLKMHYKNEKTYKYYILYYYFGHLYI